MAVGEQGKSDAPIGSFQLHQKALFPLLASAYSLFAGLNDIKRKWQEHQLFPPKTASPEAKKHLIRLCCVIKPMVTWEAVRTASTCRERCGGQGYLAINTFPSYVSLGHSGMTAEGDNVLATLE